LVKKILGSIMQTLFSGLGETIRKLVMDALQGAIRGFLKKLALALFGALLASFGIICFLFGFLRYLTLLMPEWQAWAITGMLALLAGLLALSLSMPRKRG
jgi:hypothetical protein